ncbi:hypothetical protein GCM10027418_01650 [Mariniluteicoccus endophyticus]
MAARLPRGARVTGAAREALSSELTARYEAGGSIRSMAGELGRSYGFVQALLKETGVMLRTRGGDTRGAQAVAARQATEAAVEKVRAELAARSGETGTGATADEVAVVVGPDAQFPRNERPEVEEPVPPVVHPPVMAVDETVEQARRTGAKGAGKAAKSEMPGKSGKRDAKRSDQRDDQDAKSNKDPENKREKSDKKKSDKDAKKSHKKDQKKSAKKDQKKKSGKKKS